MKKHLKNLHTISRGQHLLFVIRTSVTLWVVILAELVLIMGAASLLNEHITKFVFAAVFPGGAVFGLVFGIFLNRWLLVSHSEYGAYRVPLTNAARCGRGLGGWFESGFILLSFLALMVFIQ
ncbi:MAG: hypothetical protein E3J72_13615 [Planctomycetota bacterium]|nr:MAG: hypothetical protein E3J72_13615 [Planctomycetota bacterium]